MNAPRRVQDHPVPSFLYGTAWKEERTADLVVQALEAGFVGIDTANQRKHYHEVGVGEALARAGVARASLFLQSKYTYRRGQDHRLPYDPAAALPVQVEQSLASSLEHLGTDYLDSYVLHGPEAAVGITDGDRQVWRAMEAAQRAGTTRLIGVSNIALDQLEVLCAHAEVAPAFVQNRCYARDRWDADVRRFCRDNGIVYQGFSLLTANRAELARPAILSIADRLGATVPQVVFRFAMAVGMLPLTGTSNPRHMAEDLACADLTLGDDDLAVIEDIGA